MRYLDFRMDCEVLLYFIFEDFSLRKNYKVNETVHKVYKTFIDIIFRKLRVVKSSQNQTTYVSNMNICSKPKPNKINHLLSSPYQAHEKKIIFGPPQILGFQLSWQAGTAVVSLPSTQKPQREIPQKEKMFAHK